MNKIDIIAACSDLGLHVNGSKLGPDILINNLNKNNINKIKKVTIKNSYQKNLDINNKKKNLSEIIIFNKKLYNKLNTTFKNNCFPITIGGDHSISIASALSSIKNNNNLGIIWFDAHGDFNTFKTTTSGNIHGLPFAAVTGYEKNFLSDFHDGNYFNCKNAVLLGARDIDEPGELKNLKDAGITIITTDDIKKYGAEAMYKKAFSIRSVDVDIVSILLALIVVLDK